MGKGRLRLGLALGGGGARGWAHLGVVRALRERGLEPDVITGTSIGAMVGATLAAGTFDAFAGAVESMNVAQMAAFFIEAHLPHQGLFSGRAVTAWLERPEFLGKHSFSALPLPFAAVATDLFTGEAVVLRRGYVAKAVRASISIPGVFDPVTIQKRVLIDGGLSDPVPVAAARELGADVVIAVDLNAKAGAEPPSSTPSLLTTLLQSARLVEHKISLLTLAQHPADLLIQPEAAHIRTLDFAAGRTLIAAGERAVRAAEPALEELLHVLDR